MLEFIKSIFKPKSSNSKLNLGLSVEDQSILEKIDSAVVIGKILSIRSHKDPKMTKVRVTECDLGNGNKEQILCGAVNIVEGACVPVAKVGTTLGADFKIGERDIRGEVSRGMICAKSELGLSAQDEKKGEIWILPEEANSLLGKNLNGF